MECKSKIRVIIFFVIREFFRLVAYNVFWLPEERVLIYSHFKVTKITNKPKSLLRKEVPAFWVGSVSCCMLTQRVTKILQFHRQAKSNGFNCLQSNGRNVSLSKLQALNSATCPHNEFQNAIVRIQCPVSCVSANV